MRVTKLVRDFGRNNRGAVAVTTAFATIGIVGGMGAAIDFGRALKVSTELQEGVDNAALSAAVTAGTPDARKARADAVLAAAVRSTPSTTLIVNSDNSVTFRANVNMATMFFPYIAGSVGITRQATAAPAPATTASAPSVSVVKTESTATVTDRKVCLLVLDPITKGSFGMISNSSIDASTCEVHVNSKGTGASFTTLTQIQDDVKAANPALWFESNSNQVFKSVCAAAPASKTFYKSSGNATSNKVTNNCTTAGDPFAATLPSVTPDPCTSGNTYVAGSAPFTPVGGGTFCGFPKFTGTIPAGLYIIKTETGLSSSKLTVNSGATGSGVTFFIADDKATVAWGNANLAAPLDGLYEGILLFMPSNLVARQNVTFTSISQKTWSGLFYAPSWNVKFESFSDSAYINASFVVNQFIGNSLSKWKPSARTIFIATNGSTQTTYTTELVTGLSSMATTGGTAIVGARLIQ